MRLLLIEDNPTLAHWLARMLEQEAFALDEPEIDPDVDPLRSNPRFQAMLGKAKKRLGIAEPVAAT